MKLIKELDAQISIEEVTFKELCKVQYDEEQKVIEEKSLIIEHYFRGIMIQGDEIRKGDTSWEFIRKHPDYNYKKDYLQVCGNTDYETRGIKDLRLSVYSTNDQSDWNLDRLISVGKAAEILKEYQIEIVEKLNAVSKEAYDKAWEDRYQKEKDIAILEEDKRIYQKAEIVKQLEGGVRFIESGKYVKILPNLELKWNLDVRGLKSLKVLRRTASGKSADIEYTLQYQNWDSDKEEYVFIESEVRTEKSVRINNIDYIASSIMDGGYKLEGIEESVS
jgi:hypothetical protein